MVRKFEALETRLTNSTIMYRIIPSGTITEEAWGSRVADVWTDAADAKLLAAAPELLWRLKQLVVLYDSGEAISFGLAIEGAKEMIKNMEKET